MKEPILSANASGHMISGMYVKVYDYIIYVYIDVDGLLKLFGVTVLHASLRSTDRHIVVVRARKLNENSKKMPSLKRIQPVEAPENPRLELMKCPFWDGRFFWEGGNATAAQEGIQRQLEARKSHDVWAQRGFSDGSDDDGFQWDFGLII